MSDEIIKRLDELKAGQDGLREEVSELRGQFAELLRENTTTLQAIERGMATKTDLAAYGQSTEEKFARVARMLERLAIARAS